ncbi:MAG: C40 family peptidase [Saprospiraceae bacterium]|nr:C40 family peptidase [Saprospiraceae bacterium]
MKRVAILTFILFLYFCGNIPLTESELRDNVITTAAKLLGSPYRTGGTKESGFDCSGFVRHVLSQNNIYISRSSITQVSDGVKVDLSEVKPGDILIFKGANRKARRPGHTGLVHHIDENGVIYFIHSASSKGITIDNLNMGYYKNRFITARDVISTSLKN